MLLARVAVARSFLPRLCGLLGRDGLAPDEGLWIAPCASIHMIGMRFCVDAVFVDAAGRVLAVYPFLAPGFRTARARGAAACLEAPAGWAARAGVAPGVQIRVDTEPDRA